MTRQGIGKFLSVGLCVGALALTGCNKGSEDTTTGNDENADADDTDTGGETTVMEQPGDGDGDGDGDMTTFVPDEDILGAADCDPWAQDCPEGEKCAAVNAGGDTWNSNKCVPINGTGTLGDECTYDGATLGTDDCDLGFICYYTNDEGVGSCTPLCTGSPDDPVCDMGYNCSITNDGSLIKCLYACDPILQDCEQEGSGCFWGGGNFNCYSVSDGIPTNEPCGYINDCAPGNVCLDAEVLVDCAGASCCAPVCDLAAPDCPIDGTECSAFYDEGTAPPGYEDVGVCVIPG
jgi:hypothetical protein